MSMFAYVTEDEIAYEAALAEEINREYLISSIGYENMFGLSYDCLNVTMM